MPTRAITSASRSGCWCSARSTSSSSTRRSIVSARSGTQQSGRRPAHGWPVCCHWSSGFRLLRRAASWPTTYNNCPYEIDLLSIHRRRKLSRMRKAHRTLLAVAAVLAASSAASAHHGSAISYDTTHLWSTWATVTQFSYQNPHPTMTFDRTTKDGMVEHWVAELLTNPSVLARAGWTRGKSVDALKAGTRVKLYVGTSRAGGNSGIVMKIENDKG